MASRSLSTVIQDPRLIEKKTLLTPISNNQKLVVYETFETPDFPLSVRCLDTKKPNQKNDKSQFFGNFFL